MKKIRTIIAIAVVAALLLATAVFATPAWLKLFSQTYKPAPNSALAKAKCQVCHTKGTALNAYGAALKGKPMTAASLKAVEKLDSDKDGASNIAEIKAGTLPGDAKSKPPAKPKPGKPIKPAKPKAK